MSGYRKRGRGFSLASSGLLTALILAAVLGILGLGWAAHLKGRLHRLSTVEIPADTTVLPRPGGQDLLEMHRLTVAGGGAPEFSELTVMPGLGMGILQLSLDLPGRDSGGILLATPTEKLTSALTRETNQPTSALRFSPLSLRVFPMDGSGEGQEVLGQHPAQQFRTDILPGGTGATADFAAAPPAGQPGAAVNASGIDTRVVANISDRGFDLSIAAKNVSNQPKSIVLTWSPQFLVPGAGMQQLRITAPQTLDATTEGSAHREIALGEDDFHHVWSGLKYSYLSSGPELRLRNLADGYTLKMSALAPSIRSVRVDAPRRGETVSVSFSTANTPDGRTVIAVGETLVWHLRIQAAPSDGYVPAAN